MCLGHVSIPVAVCALQRQGRVASFARQSCRGDGMCADEAGGHLEVHSDHRESVFCAQQVCSHSFMRNSCVVSRRRHDQ